MTALAVCLSSAPALAGDNLLKCTNRGFGLQKCVLLDDHLGDAIVEDGQAYETTYTLHYDFPCTGHAVQLGVKVLVPDGGGGFQAGPNFTMGAANAIITLNGTGELHPYDPDPVTTKALTFNVACSLKVTDVHRTPSVNTIQIWSLQATAQAHAIDLATTRFKLSQDFVNLSQWNVEKLTNIQEVAQELHDNDPDNRTFQTLLNSVNQALAGQPVSATLEQLKQLGDELGVLLQAELDVEVDAGAHLQDRFRRWEVVLNP